MLKTAGFLFMITFTFSSCGKKQPEAQVNTKDVSETPVENELPLMPVELITGSNISMKDVTGKVVLILFQPDCEDCQRESVAIRKNIDAFRGYQLYFVCSHPVEIIAEFARKYDLISQPDVQFGRTTVESVLNNFGAIPAPSVYIYNETGKMKGKFNGETAVEEIITAL